MTAKKLLSILTGIGSSFVELNFDQMSRDELKSYVLTHRDSAEAVRALFRRRAPDGERHPLPKTAEDIKQMEEVFRQKINGSP